jgi:hypothetical protein
MLPHVRTCGSTSLRSQVDKTLDKELRFLPTRSMSAPSAPLTFDPLNAAQRSSARKRKRCGFTAIPLKPL